MPKPSPTPGKAPGKPSPSNVPTSAWPNGAPTAPQTPNVATTGGTDVFGLPVHSNVPGELSEDTDIFVGNDTGVTLVPMPNGELIPKKGAYTTPRYQTAYELMQQFAKMASSPKAADRQAWVNTQAQLAAIGAYGTGETPFISWGYWTPRDAEALVYAMRGYVALAEGAKQPLTFAEYLDQGAGLNAQFGGTTGHPKGEGGSGAAKPPPLSVQLTDPASIRQAAVEAAEAALGHTFSTADLDKFVAEFQAKQAAAQTAQYNASVAGQDSTVTVPDLSGEAVEFAQQAHPQEFANHQAQAYMDTFLNLFLPQESARGGITPVAPVG